MVQINVVKITYNFFKKMESPQIVCIQSLIAELELQVLNKKISGLYKQKIINRVEIDKLRNEKRNILDEYNFSNYIGCFS
ncbi:hypothetical protein FWK35_00021032 [Aphis craccivora]|uniref:Uncharacterized protein n=1 Tax=Aphis craccivora TaxID=307492 RepID=A0A6G0XCD4_APHCR|nr:hypothetical protein FWK35_00021032 [Aphis craccivora]